MRHSVVISSREKMWEWSNTIYLWENILLDNWEQRKIFSMESVWEIEIYRIPVSQSIKTGSRKTVKRLRWCSDSREVVKENGTSWICLERNIITRFVIFYGVLHLVQRNKNPLHIVFSHFSRFTIFILLQKAFEDMHFHVYETSCHT